MLQLAGNEAHVGDSAMTAEAALGFKQESFVQMHDIADTISSTAVNIDEEEEEEDEEEEEEETLSSAQHFAERNKLVAAVGCRHLRIRIPTSNPTLDPVSQPEVSGPPIVRSYVCPKSEIESVLGRRALRPPNLFHPSDDYSLWAFCTQNFLRSVPSKYAGSYLISSLDDSAVRQQMATGISLGAPIVKIFSTLSDLFNHRRSPALALEASCSRRQLPTEAADSYTGALRELAREAFRDESSIWCEAELLKMFTLGVRNRVVLEGIVDRPNSPPQDILMDFPFLSVGASRCLYVSFIAVLGFTSAFDGLNNADTEKASDCVSAPFANSCISSRGNITEYMETGELSPLIRFLGVCSGQPASVGVLLEMRAQFSLLFSTVVGEEMRVNVSLRAKPRGPELQGIPRNTTNATFETSRPADREEENKRKKKPDHKNASLEPIRMLAEIPVDRCSNTSRTLSIVMDIQTEDMSYSVFEPWLLEFTWERTPEHYEIGEVGWSSVGAHAGALSGTYSLTDVRLFLNLHSQRGLEPINPNLVGRPLVVHAEAENMFRVRAGDFYQCESEHHLLLTGPPAGWTTLGTSSGASNDSLAADNLSLSANDYGIRVLLSTRNLRLQAFSDYNDDEFTGSGVICKDDIHEDHTVTLAIGATVCAVVAISVVGLVITRLHEKDRDLRTLDATIWRAKHQIPLNRPVNAPTSIMLARCPEGCCSLPSYRDCQV
ncbi:hypothetical protein SprV_0100239200 [Sparganum proliferum]